MAFLASFLSLLGRFLGSPAGPQGPFFSENNRSICYFGIYGSFLGYFWASWVTLEPPGVDLGASGVDFRASGVDFDRYIDI